MEFNFGDNQVVDNLDKVPTDFHGLYVEDGEKFKLDSETAGVKSAISAITGLNKALVAARAEAKAHKGKVVDLSGLSEYGETPEAIAENIKVQIAEASKASKGKGAEEIEKAVKSAKEALGTEHGKQIEKLNVRNEALKSQLYSEFVQSKASSALAEAGVVDVDLALPHVVTQVGVAEEEGQYKVHVVDKGGDVRYSGTTGTHMNIKELVAEMKGNEKFHPLFKSETRSGGGTTPTTPRVKTPSGKEMSATEKIAAGLNKGQHTKGY